MNNGIKTMVSKLTYANVLSTVAVFAAMTGTAWAALTVTGGMILDGTVTSADVKNGSIRAGDLTASTRSWLRRTNGGLIKNRSVKGNDIARYTLKRENFTAGITAALRGEQGLTGATGATGAGGAIATFPTVLGSGELMTGFVGGSKRASGSKLTSDAASFPYATPTAITDADIIIVDSIADSPGFSVCTGSSAVPDAPAGKVCVYPIDVTDVATVAGPLYELYGSVGLNGGYTSKYGFSFQWMSDADGGDAGAHAVWAYRAPTV